MTEEEEPNYPGMLEAAIAFGEDSADKAILYASLALSLQRRIKAALVVLEQGRIDTAKRLLEEALADDGQWMKRRLDKVTKKFFAEHGFDP